MLKLNLIVRYGKLLVCLAIAALVAYRGTVFTDPKGASIIPTLMCLLFSISLTFTGVALSQERTA